MCFNILSIVMYYITCSSHWYVAVICHAGLYEATSSKSKSNSKSQFSSILNDSVELIESSGDVITGVLDEPFSTSTQDSPSSQVKKYMCKVIERGDRNS